VPEAEARAVERALGDFQAESLIYSTRRAFWTSMALGLLGPPALVVAGVVFLSSAMGIGGGFLGLVLAILGLSFGLVPRKVRIGHDGITERWLGRTRFHPYAEIASIEPCDGGLILVFEGGQRVEIGLALLVKKGGAPPTEQMVRHVQELHARYRAEPPVEGQSRLSRQRRGPSAWLSALKGLLTAGPDYRQAWLSREMLWSIVSSPAAEPSARAGAAVALRPTLDDADRARLRRLAEVTAAPRVRVVLEAAADGAEDEVLAEHLAAVHEHRPA
jgi:hypothetical protein